jgi:hypothetical protein
MTARHRHNGGIDNLDCIFKVTTFPITITKLEGVRFQSTLVDAST